MLLSFENITLKNAGSLN